MGIAEEHLASYRLCIERMTGNWADFQAKRLEHLRERERFGHAAEQATECILEDLFTGVLDWSIGDINHQVGHADLLLTRLGIKHLIVEAKRPGALAWNRSARDRALEQARGYADRQKVASVAVSDGLILYAADLRHGGLRDRVATRLELAEPHPSLWWLSVHGIYREPPALGPEPPDPEPLSAATASAATGALAGGVALHPKYKLPMSCFGYVGDANDPHTWHLPYLNADGSVDARRLPKAIQAILSNYRGTQVGSIPEPAIPDVLVRLACAAHSLGKLPDQAGQAAPAYVQLAAALDQLDRLDEVTS